MEDFDPTMLDSYTAVQLADYIENGQLTKQELYMDLGYHASRRPALESELRCREERRREREHLPIEDEEMWEWAQGQHTVNAYTKYLKQYDTHVPGEYRGVHVFDARQAIEDLREAEERLRVELFQSMISSPWIFKNSVIRNLVFGVTPQEIQLARTQTDIGSRFIATGNTITFDEMVNAGVVPPGFTLEKLLAPDFSLPMTTIDQLGDFPTERRTDVYFLGVPRGGKSSVLAGIFSEMQRKGVVQYVPQYNREGKDLCNAYYWGLIKAVGASQYPVSTSRDVISFLKLDLKNSRRRVNPLTFVEISGEAFSSISKGLAGGAEVWNQLGAGQCLRSNNRKLLFFIVDYSIFNGLVRGDFSDMDQLEALQNSLTVLSSDGEGSRRQKNCTMSKVDTVAVIVTKSDLMGDNLPAGVRMDMATNYLTSKFNGFMGNLYDVCRQFGINRPNNYKPYILTFSLGKLLIGNKCLYDSTDSANIIDFISCVTEGHNTGGGGIFQGIFGGGQLNPRKGTH